MTYSDREKRLINKIRRIDAVSDDDAEMADKLVYESVYSTTFRSRSEIQSTQNRFKLIRFNNGRRDQAGKLVRDKDVMVNVIDILDNTNNCLPFKNNVEYK